MKRSNFVGFENLDSIKYTTKRGKDTVCTFCRNFCTRTFIDLELNEEKKRYIIATCDKGTFEDRESLKLFLRERNKQKDLYPDFIDIYNKEAFRSHNPPEVTKSKVADFFLKKKRRFLKECVIGIPRVLNVYSTAPFFRAYFEALGVREVVFSDFTSEELYRKGIKKGSIDPCFPSKVAVSHVYNLLYEKKVDIIFFPCIRRLRGEIYKAEGHWACPTVSATPEVVKASFTKEKDEFIEKGVIYLDPVLDFDDRELLERQLYKVLRKIFGITEKENKEAINIGMFVWEDTLNKIRRRAKEVLERLEREGGVGIVMLGRPYHNDPGINHGILEELNKRGYPIFTIESLPRDEDILYKLFGKDIEKGLIEDPFDIRDVWLKCYSENSSIKVWGAKYTARHPNLLAIDLSSFRCGHDAPIYHVIESIFEEAGKPYFTFHEIDENRPSGAIKIRVETIDYFINIYKYKLSA